MTKDSNVERREKPDYEPPVAVALGELVAGQGADCMDTGSSASNECGEGNMPGSCLATGSEF